MLASKLIFKTGSRLRNPSLAGYFSFLKASESWDMDRLKAYQLERVGKLLQFAYQHSAFYRDRIDQCGLPVDRITDLDQLRQLPRLSKHHELRTKN